VPNPPLREFVDDPQISGTVILLRRIPPSWVDWDETREGVPRVTSAAFQLQTLIRATELGYPGRCLSLALEEVVLRHSDGLDALLADGWSGYGIAKLDAALLRSEDFGLQLVEEVDEPWHVAAFPKTSEKRAKKAQSVLAAGSRLVRSPAQI
jgi:hypothetical protein